MQVVCQARVSEASRDAFPSVGFFALGCHAWESWNECVGMPVLPFFLNIELGRIGSILLVRLLIG